MVSGNSFHRAIRKNGTVFSVNAEHLDMVFSTPLFLFLFLPMVLLVYVLLPGIRSRNVWLLFASLVFYAWGEVGFVLILLSSVLANFVLGRAIEHGTTPMGRKCLVTLAIVINLGLLVFFKYFNLGISTLNTLLQAFGAKPVAAVNIPLPLGISFFTFHALSYVIDIYRRKQAAAANPADAALYIFFFPQLIAGPILRWNAIAPQLAGREHNLGKFAEGIRRFVKGLAKKVLIANTVALPADQIFSLPASQLSAADAWFGAACYALQIFFDFSGYSDMAVGLGKMFGFEFLENFQFPYIAQSLRDFWRRWHISLTTWFRDYLYIPLGGNRVSMARNYLNLVTVFFLCGLWHGASWTFVVWGLYHGLFLVLEHTPFGSFIERLPRAVRHLYALLVVLVGWVVFRADNFAAAASYLCAMSGLGDATEPQLLVRYATNGVLCAILVGIICSTPLLGELKIKLAKAAAHRPRLRAIGCALEVPGILILLFLSTAWLAGGTYNPFIYFRF
jgi:alginate O-acetyltransferase complex protein AlgI